MDRKRSSFGDRMAGSRQVDTMGPKKELERAGRQLDLVMRESKKTFQREMRQMERKMSQRASTSLDRDPRSRNISVMSSTGPRISTVVPPQGTDTTTARATGGVESQRMQRSISISRDSGPDFSAQQHQLTPAEKQADALRQLRYLHELVLGIIKEAQIQVYEKGEAPPSAETKRPKVSGVTYRNESLEEDNKSTLQVLPSSTGHKKFSRVSTSDSNDPATDSQLLQSGVSTPLIDDLLGTPSPAVEMISLAKAMCAGRHLDTKQVKALTSVLEECRYAVKSIKGGMDSERAQERLVKRLNELLELVKPLGSDLLISPAEILRCSYLRLSPGNIQTMERMMLEQGLTPGIHSHSKVENLTLQQLRDIQEGRPVATQERATPHLPDQARSTV